MQSEKGELQHGESTNLYAEILSHITSGQARSETPSVSSTRARNNQLRLRLALETARENQILNFVEIRYH